MLQINSLNKSYQDQLLFFDVSFSINKGERLGLVGRNGTGKSTLFKIILGDVSADDGEVTKPNNYRIGSISQYIEFKYKTVLEECMSVLSKDYALETYRAEKLLTGLGFEKDDFLKDPQSFSGGFQVRINLVKALLQEPNLLLLDEPTNYLDISSIEWLISFLRSFKGEVFLITHDRSFMNRVCDSIIGIHNCRVKKISGSTKDYYDQLAQEEEILKRTHENILAKRAQLEEFITKFRAKASKASQAKSKQKQLDRMDEVIELENTQNINLNFEYSNLDAKNYLTCNQLIFGYRANDILIDDFNLTINKGDKVGIVGKNGKGKSTLLNLLYGTLRPLKGEIKYHEKLQIGYFGQTNIDRLNSELSIVDEVVSANPDLSISKSRAICGAMMFTKDQADKKIKVLSGGERSRVLLAKVLASPTNLLFLDEPTNHLDMESIEIFKDKLIDYQGSLLIVTHSKEFLEGVVNKIIYFKNGKVDVFEGSYSEFENKIGLTDPVDNNTDISNTKRTKKEVHALRQEIIKEKSKEIRPLEKMFKELHQELESLEFEEESLNVRLKDLNSEDNDELLEISQKIGMINQEIEIKLDEVSLLEVEINNINLKFEKRLDEI